MPRPYILKKSLISKETLDRLFKIYIDSVKKDKIKASDLYDRAILLLNNAMDNVGDEGVITALKALEVAIKAQANETSLNRGIKNVLVLIRDFIEKPVKDPKNVNSELADDIDTLFKDLSKGLKDDGEED